jgi:hypothetical membrane protein
MNPRTGVLRHAGVVALLSALIAAAIGGAALDGYSHRDFPLAYLGAEGIPGAAAFNLFAFLLPGLLAFAVAWALRAGLPAQATWRARIGARLIALAALGYAAQGVLPLRPEDLGATVNGLHASVWMLWWIAFLSGAVLLAFGRVGWRLAVPGAVAAVVIAVLVLTPWDGAMTAIAPRLAFLVWLLWTACVPMPAGRGPSISRA